MGPLAGMTHRPTRRPLAQTPSARLWERRPMGSPLCLASGRLGLVLEDELEAEQFGEKEQAIQGQARGVSFERGESTLADTQLGCQRLLGNAACFAPPTEDLAYLPWGGDELTHGSICLTNKTDISATRIKSIYLSDAYS